MTTGIGERGGEGSPYTLLVGRHTGVTTVEITMQVPHTRTHKYKYWTCVSSRRDLRQLPTGTCSSMLNASQLPGYTASPDAHHRTDKVPFSDPLPAQSCSDTHTHHVTHWPTIVNNKISKRKYSMYTQWNCIQQ